MIDLDINELLKVSTFEAGKILLKYFKTPLDISQKQSIHSIVTIVDLESQKIIQETIIDKLEGKGIKRLDIGFIGEENLNEKGKYLFIIDPLDGTTNFASGFPYFCVSIACAINNEIQYGLIYNPISSEFYFAEKGKGAYKLFNKNKTKLSIKKAEMKNILMNGHFNSNNEIRRKQLNLYNKLMPQIRGFRSVGALALDLALSSENIFNIVVNGSCCLWDIAAGGLIITESGGLITDWEGKDIDYDFNNSNKDYQVIAGEKEIVKKAVEMFKQQVLKEF